LWIRHGDTGGAWDHRPSDPEAIAATGLFGPPVRLMDENQAILTASEIISLESTRATFLNWPPDIQRRFAENLRQALELTPTVHLTRHTSVAMAQVRGDRSLRGVGVPVSDRIGRS
jgi:hypothetical protein